MKLKSLIDVMGKTPHSLDKEDADAFITMSMLDIQKPDFSAPIDDKSPIGLRILQNRLEWAGLADKVAFPVKLFLSCLCDRPGKVVMWAYTLAHILEKKKNLGQPKVNMHLLAQTFPFGFPSEDEQEACWNDQKGHVHGVKADNLMDIKEWWQ